MTDEPKKPRRLKRQPELEPQVAGSGMTPEQLRGLRSLYRALMYYRQKDGLTDVPIHEHLRGYVPPMEDK
jgi:hypothetical protein